MTGISAPWAWKRTDWVSVHPVCNGRRLDSAPSPVTTPPRPSLCQLSKPSFESLSLVSYAARFTAPTQVRAPLLLRDLTSPQKHQVQALLSSPLWTRGGGTELGQPPSHRGAAGISSGDVCQILNLHWCVFMPRCANSLSLFRQEV